MPDEKQEEPAYHHYEHATQFDPSFLSFNVCNTDLHPVQNAFKLNMRRIQALSWLPIKLVSVAMLQEGKRVQALHNLGIDMHDPGITVGHPNFDPEKWNRVDDERQRLVYEFQHSCGSEEGFNRRMTDSGILGVRLIVQGGQQMGGQDEFFGMQGILYALLTEAWTAFESLAQDLWVRIVNSYPVPLAQRVLEPNANLETGNPVKSVSWKTIKDFKFDLTADMGTLLLRQNSVDFQRLKSIRAAYSVAFDGETDAIFDHPNHSKLPILEVTRNLLAHKGGVVDKKFKDRVSNVPGLAGVEEGVQLFFTGPVVKEHINAASRCAIALLAYVDEWIEKEKAKTTL